MDCFAICSSITQMETQGNKRKSGIYLKGRNMASIEQRSLRTSFVFMPLRASAETKSLCSNEQQHKKQLFKNEQLLFVAAIPQK